MMLYEGQIGQIYLIQHIRMGQETAGRLEALGLSAGTPVSIANKKRSGSVIIKIRGTRLALGRQITQGIWIEKEV